MNNNELLKIKDQKQKFYTLRKEIVGDSCREVKKQVEEYKAYLAKYPKDEALVRNPSIRKSVLDSLEWSGYDLSDKGTQYLASLITIFFHERKLYRRGDIEDKSYWNLKDWSNEHYKMLGNTSLNVINEILDSIEKNELEDGSIAEIVYTNADFIGFYNKDRDDKKRVPYVRMLVRQ